MLLSALPYHVKVRDHFYNHKKTWEFFASAKTRDDQLINFKTDLLKNTYKFDPLSDSALYEKVNIAKIKLDLEQLPVTIYQAQYTDELNASIVSDNGEAHIVLSGKIIQLLDDRELLAVIAHELTHVKLYSMLNGDMEITDRIVTAIANNYHSEAASFETARLFRLYTEIFCDRGAMMVVGDTTPIITSLVKLATGLQVVSAKSYIKQAEEIVSVEGAASQANAMSHPDNFIRAKAIDLWQMNEKTADDQITKIIEGHVQIDQLDIFKQTEVTNLTKELLQLYLQPKWFQSSLVLSLAKQYFPAFSLKEQVGLNEELPQRITGLTNSVKEYLSYVLLDFCLVDPSLEEIPHGWAFEFAQNCQIKDEFEQVLKKEMKFSDKKLQHYKSSVLSTFHEVRESDQEQLHEH